MIKPPRYTKYDIQKTSGYTLIEILVALTIVGILFGVGYANFRDFTRRQTLLGTSKKIQADLRVAQALALSGQVPNDPNCTGTNRLNGYFFNVISATNYEIRASCSGGVVGVATKDVVLSPGITIANPLPVPNPILFKVLGNGTNISGGNAQITISQAGNPDTTAVTISSGGQIQPFTAGSTPVPTPTPAPGPTATPGLCAAPVLSGSSSCSGSLANFNFTWSSVSGAVLYRWQFSNDSGFNTLLTNITTSSTSRTESGLSPGTYYGRVRVYSSDGSCTAMSAFSNTVSITKGCP